MNKNMFRLLFSRCRGMPVAVAETAIAYGNASQNEVRFPAAPRPITLFAMRRAAFAALVLCGFAPVLADAQIVPSGAHAPNVISTANGLPQVNINKASGAGVSLNTYSQFDIQKNGAILNNSPVITSSQLAGQINGNPNFGPHDAAKIIINQVNSNNPSLLRGYVEVAGQKAAVVIANPSGLVVDGGGFINTSRGILTTGNPLIDGSGNLTGFNVTGGTIAVQGTGFNASNVDQVDLIARAVQANAAIYANTLNVTTGANRVDYAGLNATPIAGTGAAPAVSIDVSQLGGMYANRITLVSNENGVGVANAGTIAAQAGELTLTTSGQLVQTGRMTASGNAGINAASVANSGTIYAQRNTVIGTAGALTNSGAIAAQRNTTINAGSVSSTGALGAGVNNDGSVGNAGDLDVATSGQLSATGEDVAGGNATLTAHAGDLNLAGATTSAGGTVNVQATGALVNDHGTLTGGAVTLNAGSLSNQGGSIVAPDLALTIGRTLDNSGGDIEANQLALGATDLLNRGGTITQYGALPMSFDVSRTFDNSNGGLLQTNSTNLTLAPAALDNDGGTILDAGTGTLTIAPANGAGAISNIGGQIIAAGRIVAQAGSLNNTSGVLAAQGNIAASIAGDVRNTQGAIRSLASLSLISGGALTTTNGQIQSGTGVAGDASTLAIQAASIDNTGGLVSNLGTGDATVQGGNQTVNSSGVITGHGDVAITATGTLTNTNGQIGATHDLSVKAETLMGGGAYSAAHDVAVTIQGDFASSADFQFGAGHDLAFTLPGTFNNGATLEAVNNLGINADDIENSGVMMAGGTLITHSNTLENTGAMVGGSVSFNAAQSITNVGPAALIGATDSNGTLELLAPDIGNRDDTTLTDTQATTAIYGLGKVVLAGGRNADGSYSSANLIRNQSGLIQSGGDMVLDAAQVTNTRTTMTTTGFNQPVDPAMLAQRRISLSGCTAIDMAACSGQQVGWPAQPDPNLIGGAYIEPPHGGQWNSGYQYTTYTGVALANLIASISPQAQIIAGGDLDASNVGLFQNDWSAVAAAGNIAAPVTLDQNSWQGQTAPAVQVTYSGYYHYNNYDNSERDWTLPFGDAPFAGSHPGGYSQAAPADIRYYALPGYESTFVAGGTLSGTGVSIDNTAGNATIPSPGLVPGESVKGVDIGAVSGAGPVDPVIASATAVNVLGHLTIPQGGLFRRDTAPDAPYLIETNPAFTSRGSFISSDYYLQQLGLNPQNVERRLGDGLYEQQFVRNQITSLTGNAVLGPHTDLQSMYQSLLDAGASLSKSLDLPLGMSLSPDQVAALTSNVIIMQTEIVDRQSVLVPVVYLAKASQRNMNGPLIAATDIDLQNAQTFTNSGTVQAGNALSIQGQQIGNAFGTLQSGGLMSLTTTGNVDLTSATVNAGSLALNAGGDLMLNTAVKTVDQVSATGATRTTITLGPIANLNVAGDAAIVTGGNVEQNAGNLNVGGSLGMSVGGNWDLGSVQTGEHKVVARANGISDTSISRTTGSSVNVGGVSTIGVGGDLTATGADISLAGGGVIAAKGDVTLQAAKATSTIDSNSSGSDSHGSYSESLHRSADVLTATTLNAGNSLTVASGHDINVTGSTINLDQGTATLAAANNVNIGAATATYVDNSQEQHSHGNVVSGKEVSSSRDTTTTLSQGSMISADGVSISSGNDLNVAGSTIVGTNDVALSAAHDVNITTTQDTSQGSSFHEEKKTGFGAMSGGGLSLNYGTSDTKETTHDSSVTNNGSLVGSTNGNLSIQAGHTLHVTGSDLVAARNVTGTAASVIIDAATGTAHHDETREVKQSGFTLGLSGSVGDAINGAYQQGQALASGNSNGRAEALHAIAAGGDVAMAGIGAAGLAGGAAGPNAPGIGVQLSFGSSQSKNTFTEDQTTQKGSNVQAAGTAAFVATGDGTPGSGNLTVAGSNVSANDVVLAAKNQVNIVNTTNTDTTASTNRSSSASVGVSYGTQGFGVSASMSNAHGDGNSDAAIRNASHVSGANSVTVVSGGDTSIIGSQVSGNQVTAQVGGNLNIRSVQDTTVSTAHQSSAGGGFSISQGGGSASFSAQNGHADSNYAQVNEQAGIQAGSGGFDINVRGNTDLTGAVISSTADASQNSLTTGTLSYSDIRNQSHYSASSNGVSAGVGVGNTGKALGPGSVSGSGGVVPMMSQNGNGDESVTTRSAVSAGAINITDGVKQTQDVAGLSRDTTNTNVIVSNTPDVNNLLSQQADTMQAAQAAGQVVAQGIGAYADAQRQSAVDQATADAANGDWAAYATDVVNAKQWDEGGDSRAILQAAGGALIGGLGGGSVFTAVGGGLGAGLASKMANQLDSLSKGVAAETGSGLLGNLAGNVVANVGGALVGGGTAGAVTATNVDLYNRQLDTREKSLAQQLADASDGKYTVTQIEDQMRQMDMSANGTTTSGSPATLVGQTPSDSGARWMSAGTTANGQPVLTQIPAPTDSALQSYILANYNSVSPGQVPGEFTYPSSNSGGSINVTGPFTNFDQSDLNYVRSTTADAASMVSTNAGRVSAAAAAASKIPSPYSGILEGIAFGATVTGVTADAIQQLVQPDVGQYTFSGAVGVANAKLSDKIPALGPAFNETANAITNSSTGKNVQTALDGYWNSFYNYWSEKQ
ncbi:hemagglutinin repeat-containing protein [Paraburkholderia sp.]|uniref:hemagglutinin repeat-containing protein n=1 Tax=Paraburkholderia sp. TaxID=1926495 RepID=UPI0039E4B262